MTWKIRIAISLFVTSISLNAAWSAPTFFTLDRSMHPAASVLNSFSADPLDANPNQIAPVLALPTFDSRYAWMDYSGDNRLFVVPHDATSTERIIYELDPTTGASLGEYNTGLNSIEGLAVAQDGIIYVSVEGGPSDQFWAIDFDQQQKSLVVSGAWEIDDIDFDADGNLIGSDINGSGDFYRIPLDGSAPQLLANISSVPVVPMTFSSVDSAFYFSGTDVGTGGRQLWRLQWSAGLPLGDAQFVKDIGPGEYTGLAAIPEPSTIFWFICAGAMTLRRRR